MGLTFQEENNELLKEILKTLANEWTGQNKDNRFLELYITADCN